MPVSPDENVGAVFQCSGPIGVCSAMSNYWSCAKVVHRSAERCKKVDWPGMLECSWCFEKPTR